MAGSSAALWPTETHSASLERSKPFLLTQSLLKSFVVFLMYSISVQTTLISIVLISKGAVFVGLICMEASMRVALLHPICLKCESTFAHLLGISAFSQARDIVVLGFCSKRSCGTITKLQILGWLMCCSVCLFVSNWDGVNGLHKEERAIPKGNSSSDSVHCWNHPCRASPICFSYTWGTGTQF